MSETASILRYHAQEGRVFDHANDTVVVNRTLLRTAADEIERLRAALEKIAHLTPMILTGADSPAAHLAQRMGVIATDALEQKAGNDD